MEIETETGTERHRETQRDRQTDRQRQRQREKGVRKQVISTCTAVQRSFNEQQVRIFRRPLISFDN